VTEDWNGCFALWLRMQSRSDGCSTMPSKRIRCPEAVERQTQKKRLSCLEESRELLGDLMGTKESGDKLRVLQRSAGQLHSFVSTYQPGRQLVSRWSRIEGELQEIRVAYEARTLTRKQHDSTASPSSGSRSCLEEAGEERMARLVVRCLEVSPRPIRPAMPRTNAPSLSTRLSAHALFLAAATVPHSVKNTNDERSIEVWESVRHLGKSGQTNSRSMPWSVIVRASLLNTSICFTRSVVSLNAAISAVNAS
jgi:hypothetical protein